MAERQVTRRRSEWCRAVVLAFVVPVALVGIAYGILYAVARGLAQFGFIGTGLPGLSRVGLYLAALGCFSAAITGWFLRPRDVSNVRGAGAHGGSGPARVRVWGAPDDLDGAPARDGDSESVTP